MFLSIVQYLQISSPPSPINIHISLDNYLQYFFCHCCSLKTSSYIHVHVHFMLNICMLFSFFLFQWKCQQASSEGHVQGWLWGLWVLRRQCKVKMGEKGSRKYHLAYSLCFHQWKQSVKMCWSQCMFCCRKIISGNFTLAIEIQRCQASLILREAPWKLYDFCVYKYQCLPVFWTGYSHWIVHIW